MTTNTPPIIRVGNTSMSADSIVSLRIESCRNTSMHTVVVMYVFEGREVRMARIDPIYRAIAFQEYCRIDDEWYHAMLRAANTRPVNDNEPADIVGPMGGWLTNEVLY